MRMRVLTHTNKGKLLAIADDVTKLISADKATDSIPPDYNCDGERLEILMSGPDFSRRPVPAELLYTIEN